MKVYVEELPKKCLDCVCFNKVNGRCQLKHLYIDTDLEPTDCPLQSLSDYTKQVRKELISEIKEKLKLQEIFHIDYDFYYKEDVENILNQIN